MWSSLKNSSDAALLVVRCALGLLLLALHGWPKLLNAFSIWIHHGGHQSGINAVWATFYAIVQALACVFVILGIWMRPACLFFALIVGLKALAEYHTAGWAHAELEIELTLFFAALIFVGAGRFSLDKA